MGVTFENHVASSRKFKVTRWLNMIITQLMELTILINESSISC